MRNSILLVWFLIAANGQYCMADSVYTVERVLAGRDSLLGSEIKVHGRVFEDVRTIGLPNPLVYFILQDGGTIPAYNSAIKDSIAYVQLSCDSSNRIDFNEYAHRDIIVVAYLRKLELDSGLLLAPIYYLDVASIASVITRVNSTRTKGTLKKNGSAIAEMSFFKHKPIDGNVLIVNLLGRIIVTARPSSRLSIKIMRYAL